MKPNDRGGDRNAIDDDVDLITNCEEAKAIIMIFTDVVIAVFAVIIIEIDFKGAGATTETSYFFKLFISIGRLEATAGADGDIGQRAELAVGPFQSAWFFFQNCICRVS